MEISIYTENFQDEYISLTDIAKYKSDEPSDVIKNWMRSKDTIEFLGLWEKLHNPNFKPVEFDGFKNQAGSNSFTLAPQKWIEATNATGVVSKSGRYGGTFAHSDIVLNLLRGFQQSLSFTSLKIIKDLKTMKAANYP